MEVLLPFSDLMQAGLRAVQISESVWLVPCTVSPAVNEFSPMLRPFNVENKQKSRHTWSLEEDEILTRIVDGRGPKNWNLIAKELNVQLYEDMPVRQGKQCRERWYNHLDPTLKKGSWRVEEDIYLLQMQIEIGNRWSEIAKGLQGRTENSVKNRWKCMIKKAKRRYPQAANLADLILLERKQKFEEPTDTESETSEDQSRLLASAEDETHYAPSYEPPYNSSEGYFSPQPLVFNSPTALTPSVYVDSSQNTLPMQGFSQYAEFVNHFAVSTGRTPRETEFSPSPSVFLRSPH
jgi:hypothetical protein